jgi:hypothetical protein
MRTPTGIRHREGTMLQHMVLRMDNVNSILDSAKLNKMGSNLVRPAFEDTSTWEDFIRILEDNSANAFGCSASNRTLTQGNK